MLVYIGVAKCIPVTAQFGRHFTSFVADTRQRILAAFPGPKEQSGMSHR